MEELKVFPPIVCWQFICIVASSGENLPNLEHSHFTINAQETAALVYRVVGILPGCTSFWCLTRVSPVEAIKGQLLRSWELPSHCSWVINISKPGLHQEAAFGVNELKREEKIGVTSYLPQLGFIPGTRRASTTRGDNPTGYSWWKHGHFFKQAKINLHGQ